MRFLGKQIAQHIVLVGIFAFAVLFLGACGGGGGTSKAIAHPFTELVWKLYTDHTACDQYLGYGKVPAGFESPTPKQAAILRNASTGQINGEIKYEWGALAPPSYPAAFPYVVQRPRPNWPSHP